VRRGQARLWFPVYFGQQDDRIVFPHSALWAVPRFANRFIAEEIEKFAAALNTRVAPRATISEQAEQGTRALLASGVRANSASVGRRLGISSRTLQRRLAEEGTSFRALRDAVLWEAVEVLLSNPSLKIEAIALSVGFSDAAAFSKALVVGRVTHRRVIGKPSHARGTLGHGKPRDELPAETLVSGLGAGSLWA
jgi:AraC-like DNA-binding protein